MFFLMFASSYAIGQETLQVAPSALINVPGVKDPIIYALGFKVGSDMRGASLEASDFDVEQFTNVFLECFAKKEKVTPE